MHKIKVVGSAVVFLAMGLNAADGVWTAGAGAWTNTASWSGGTVPGVGNAASFTGAGGTVTVPGGYPFTLASLFFNTNGANVAWTIAGETNALVSPAIVRVDANTATLSATLTGSAGLVKSGNGVLELTASNNLFSGKVTVSGGLLRVRADSLLGQVPGSLAPDAITLNGGGMTDVTDPLTLHANRGVTVGSSNAWFLARFFVPFVINGPITGPGAVTVARQSDAVVFANTANDYAGDTTLGSDDLGYWSDPTAAGLLKLGADEVIPHGAGKGRLVFNGYKRGILDLNGKTETVNTVVASGDLSISNSAVQPGVLKAGVDNGNMGFGGEIQARATLEKIGSGKLVFDDNGRSQGGIKVSGGSLDFSRGSSLGTMTVTLNGAPLNMTDTQPGLVESVASITNGSVSLTVPATENGVRLTTAKGNTGVSGFNNYTQYGYSGQWYVSAGGAYSFAKGFDDGAYLAIDGSVILNNSIASSNVVAQNVALTAGWHTVDVRFSQGSGAFGPLSNFSSGIIYDPSNSSLTNASDLAAARRFEDTGDGTVLRTLTLAGSTNMIRARLELAQNGTFNRSATTAALVWAGDLVAATNAVGTPVLTVTGGAEPFRIGSTNRSVVFGADVSDPNGVVFQDKVWLQRLPASSTWSVKPGAEVAVGAAGLLGAGPMSLTNLSVRIPAADALGAGGETVTVGGVGNTVWFDATRQVAGMLLNDSAYAFTASNNVVLTGTGARAGFDGAGTVTYAGAISGSGTLVKNGSGDAVLTAANSFSGGVQVNAGRLRVGDDTQLGNSANAVTLSGGYLGNSSGANPTLARNVQVTSGGFDVQDASLTLSGVTAGTAGKRGAGTLNLTGTSANPALDLSVAAGVAVLDKSGVAAVRHITGVVTGATVRIAGSGGNQIAGNVTLTGGVLDLNGRSETIGQLMSATVASVVTNGGGVASVMSVGESNLTSTFFGTLADGGAKLGLTKTGTNNTFALLGGPAAQRYTGETRVEGGTLAFGTGMRYVRFTVTSTRTGGQNPGVSEFQLLRDGVYVPCPTDTLTYATSQSGPTGGPERLIDSDTVTKWLAGAPSGQYFRVDLRNPMAFNGYRWYTANDAPERDPISWTVEVSPDNATWYTADVQTNQVITGTRSMLAGAWNLQPPFAGGCAVASGSAFTVTSNALAQVFSMNEAVTSLAGGGRLYLSTDEAFSAGDLSGFTGRLTGDGRLTAGGAGGETVFSHLSSSPGQTIVNNGSAALAVRVGGNTNASFTASVRDGAAPAGLVKRGTQTLLLYGSASAYTGDTRIEEGTVAVMPGTISYRYLRFTPTQTRGVSGYPVSLSEFQLVRNGSVVTWPTGTAVTSSGASYTPQYPATNAIDGNFTTDAGRWISALGVFPNSLIFDMKQPVTFDGYQYYTGTSSGNDNARDPISWTLEASDNGSNWALLDVRTGEAVADVRGALVGPYLLGGRPAVPLDFWAVTNSLSEKVGAVRARYLRFNPTQMRLGTNEYTYTGFQVSELQLLTNGAPVLYPAGTTATAPGGGYNDGGSNVLLPISAVDNVVPTGNTNNRWYSTSMVNPLTVDVGQPVTFNGYRWYTALNGSGRDPISWTLEISNNATNWCVVDVQTNQLGTMARNALAGTWPLNILARGGASGCAIPDASKTSVASGATLRLERADETVGPLSGAGTVTLVGGATLGINGTTGSSYAGGITGTGTVAKTGAAAQTLSGALAFSGTIIVDKGVLSLDGAVLTGVTNIVLRSGGELTGTATVNGNLTVTFAGGVYNANLTVSGALTTVGSVLLKVPDGATLPITKTLFTFGTADAPTRAALAAAVTQGVPHGYVATVRLTSNAVCLAVAAPGTVLMVR